MKKKNVICSLVLAASLILGNSVSAADILTDSPTDTENTKIELYTQTGEASENGEGTEHQGKDDGTDKQEEKKGEEVPEETKEVTEIKVTLPTKTEYIVGEELDLTGMKVEAVYHDNTTEDVTEKAEVKVTDFDSKKVGKQTITVTYEERTATFTVTVKEEEPENPLPENLDDVKVTITPADKIDMDNVKAGDELSFEIKIKNNGEEDLHNIGIDAVSSIIKQVVEKENTENDTKTEEESIETNLEFNIKASEDEDNFSTVDEQFLVNTIEKDAEVKVMVKTEVPKNSMMGDFSVTVSAKQMELGEDGKYSAVESIEAKKETIEGKIVSDIEMEVKPSSSSTNLDQITAGKTLTFKIKVKNNSIYNVENINITAEYAAADLTKELKDGEKEPELKVLTGSVTKSDDISILEDDKRLFIKEIEAGKDKEIQVKVTVPTSVKEGDISFVFGASVMASQEKNAKAYGTDTAILKGKIVKKSSSTNTNTTTKTNTSKTSPKTGETSALPIATGMLLLSSAALFFLKRGKRL